jgi:hypothetical protein
MFFFAGGRKQKKTRQECETQLEGKKKKEGDRGEDRVDTRQFY